MATGVFGASLRAYGKTPGPAQHARGPGFNRQCVHLLADQAMAAKRETRTGTRHSGGKSATLLYTCFGAAWRVRGKAAALQHKRRGNLNFSGMFWFQLVMVSWHGKPPGIQWQVHDALVTVWPNRPRPGVVAHPWSRSSGKPLSNKMTFSVSL